MLRVSAFILACLVCSAVLAQHVGVPRIDPDYDKDVVTWWASHPYNPAATTPLDIHSPEPVVRLAPGASIQSAIDKLETSGGTIELEAGAYDGFSIIGVSNIHVVCPTGRATIKGRVRLAVCEEATDYGKYDRLISKPSRDAKVFAKHLAPTRNFRFANLDFDGEGKLESVVALNRVYDVLFDGCSFVNTINSRKGHAGQVVGNEGLNNIWFRRCAFKGACLYATYLDGLHGGGMIDCTVDAGAFSSGGFLFLTNDDFTDDLNSNGKIEPSEERSAKYIVIAGNTFDGNLHTAVQVTGANVLVERNRAMGKMAQFVGIDPRFSHQVPTLTYRYEGIVVRENAVGDCRLALVHMNNALKTPAEYQTPTMGRYSVESNRVRSAPLLVKESGTIIGPNSAPDDQIETRTTP